MHLLKIFNVAKVKEIDVLQPPVSDDTHSGVHNASLRRDPVCFCLLAVKLQMETAGSAEEKLSIRVFVF